jgi:hypothetical protein
MRLLAMLCVVNEGMLVGPATGNAGAAEFPRVRVDNVRRAFHNGEHNAFTDLIRFRGKFYLTFRSCPDGHMVHPTSSIIVLCSEDARQWKQVHRFRIPYRDPRDPHFLAFQGRLFVYSGTWYSGEATLPPGDYDLNLHLGYACVSDDGDVWSEPILLEGTFGHYIWRASSHDGKAYLCGRRKTAFAVADRGEGDAVESAMLESDDGLVWRTRALFQTERGDETAFLFEEDGVVLGIARRGRGTAQLLRSQPPYAEWRRTDLGRYVGGPLLTRWGDRYLVGGRNLEDPQRPATALYWLDGDALRPCAELPSGGDTSYPGFVALDADQGLVSWYSSHEVDERGRPLTAIYLADLAIEP